MGCWHRSGSRKWTSGRRYPAWRTVLDRTQTSAYTRHIRRMAAYQFGPAWRAKAFAASTVAGPSSSAATPTHHILSRSGACAPGSPRTTMFRVLGSPFVCRRHRRLPAAIMSLSPSPRTRESTMGRQHGEDACVHGETSGGEGLPMQARLGGKWAGQPWLGGRAD